MNGGIYKYAHLLGEWQIGEVIGKGSYGEVYKIFKIVEGQRIEAAAKYISIPRDEDKKAYRKYTDEELKTLFQERADKFSIEIASMLKLRYSPNVVRYEDHIKQQKEDGLGWDIIIRMELLTPLEDYLDTRSFTRKDVAKLGMDICGAIECCQDNDIIHRDIKIENIFVDNYNTYKLGDFGVSKVGSGTATGTVTGTEDYMAPEITKEHKYNKTVDIYALGIAMYQLLNNRRKPFIDADSVPGQDAEAQAHLQRITGKEMPPPKYADGELERIVLKACAYDKDDRYSSPREMAQDLKNIYDVLPDETILEPRKSRNFDKSVDKTEGDYSFKSGTVTDFDSTDRNATIADFNSYGGGGGTISDIRPLVKPEKKSKKGLIITLLIMALLTGIAVGAYFFLTSSGTSVPVSDIGGLPEETVQIVVGDKYELKPELLPADAKDKITYVSDDETIATVDENGVVTTVSAGDVEISVTAGSVTKEIKFNITAQKVDVTGITGIDSSYSITAGSEFKLNCRVEPSNATVQEISYMSSDPTIATVESDGYVTAIKAGTVTITAEADGVKVETVVTVKAKQQARSQQTKPQQQTQAPPQETIQPQTPQQPQPEQPKSTRPKGMNPGGGY